MQAHEFALGRAQLSDHRWVLRHFLVVFEVRERGMFVQGLRKIRDHAADASR